MSASNPSGEMQFWIDGLPFSGVQKAGTDGGEMQFWYNGQPYSYIFPPLLEQNYTWQYAPSLPTDVTELANTYSGADLTDVGIENSSYVNAIGHQQYLIHLFKDLMTGSETSLGRKWVGQSTSTNVIYLQIYNFDSSSWETVDSGAGSSSTTLEGTISVDVSDYLDANNVSAWRVYQGVS